MDKTVLCYGFCCKSEPQSLNRSRCLADNRAVWRDCSSSVELDDNGEFRGQTALHASAANIHYCSLLPTIRQATRVLLSRRNSVANEYNEDHMLLKRQRSVIKASRSLVRHKSLRFKGCILNKFFFSSDKLG